MADKEFWDCVNENLCSLTEEQQEKLAAFVYKVWPVMEDVFEKQATMSSAVNNAQQAASNKGKSFVGGVFGALRGGLNLARQAKQAIGKGVDAAGRGINAIGNAVNKGIDAAGNAINTGVNAVGRGWNTATNAATNAYNTVADTMQAGYNSASNAVNNAYNSAYNYVRPRWNAGLAAAENAANYVQSIPGRGVDFANRTYNAGVNAIGNAANQAQQYVGNRMQQAGNMFNKMRNMTPDELLSAAERRATGAVDTTVNAIAAPYQYMAQKADDAANWAGNRALAASNFMRNQYNSVRNNGAYQQVARPMQANTGYNVSNIPR